MHYRPQFQEMQAIHGDCMTRIRQGINARNAQLNAVLSPEQQKRFEQSEKSAVKPGKAGSPGTEGLADPVPMTVMHQRSAQFFRSQRPSSDTNSPAQP